MASTRVITKNLAGVEDLLYGTGTQTQTRQEGSYEMTKNRVIRPVDSIADRDALDTDLFPECSVIESGVITFYQYDGVDWIKLTVG